MDALLFHFGDSNHFDAAIRIKNYLMTEAGLETVEIVCTKHLSKQRILGKLKDSLDAAPSVRPFFLGYIGHGDPKGWGINCHTFLRLKIWQIAPYKEVAQIIKDSRKLVMFVNTCCYAKSVAAYLKDAGVGFSQVSLIAACRESETTDITMLGRIMRSWRQHNFHTRVIESVVRMETRLPKEDFVEKFRMRSSELLNQWFPWIFRSVYCGKLDTSLTEVKCSVKISQEVRWGVGFDRYFFSPKKEDLMPVSEKSYHEPAV